MTRSIVINILLPICFLFFIADVEAKVKVRTNDGELVSIEQLADSSVVDSVLQNKAKAFFKKVGVFADNWFMRGADTNYIALPKYRFRLAINGEAGSVHTILSSEHIPYYWGIICVSDKDDVVMSREAGLNPKVKLTNQFQLLWKKKRWQMP